MMTQNATCDHQHNIGMLVMVSSYCFTYNINCVSKACQIYVFMKRLLVDSVITKIPAKHSSKVSLDER